MLLVVVGAGASFDNGVNTGTMPLVGGLFDGRAFNRDALSEFHEAQPIVNRLRLAIEKGENTAEELLAKINDEAKVDLQRQKQLIALRLYLRRTIFCANKEIIAQGGGITAYTTLITKLDTYVKNGREPVMIVDFNYDSLLENAMSSEYSNPFETFTDYVKVPKVKLIKPHGSIKWFTKVDIPEKEITTSLDLIKYANWFHPDDGDPYVEKNWDHPSPNLDLPLMAVPIKDKQFFSCPDFFIKHLEEEIPKTTKIVTIGWRGVEEHFKDILSTIEVKPPAFIIGRDEDDEAGGRKGTDEIIDNLSSLIADDPIKYPHGFAASMRDDAFDRFLNDS